jgi:hypothetical protein
MEAKIWYKGKGYNDPLQRQALAEYELSVPTAEGGKLAFKDICGDYLRKGDKR